MSELVIDLSHHNTIPKSLTATAYSGVRGVIHKATEASYFVDKKVQARYHLAQEAGMHWGCYHFIRPGSGEQQAKFFVDTMKNLGVLDDNTLVAADHEDSAAPLELLMEFLLAVEELTGRAPVIYSGHVLKEQLANYTGSPIPYRLWLAQYSSTPKLPKGFDRYWLWQYTDQGTVVGVDPPTDMNKYDGTEEELAAEWSGKLDYSGEGLPPVEEPAPEIPSEEKEVTVTVDVYSPPGVKVNVIVVNPGPED